MPDKVDQEGGSIDAVVVKAAVDPVNNLAAEIEEDEYYDEEDDAEALKIKELAMKYDVLAKEYSDSDASYNESFNEASQEIIAINQEKVIAKQII